MDAEMLQPIKRSDARLVGSWKQSGEESTADP